MTSPEVRCVLLIANGGGISQDTEHRAGYMVYHPERNILLPYYIPITSYAWKWLENIRDAGMIYIASKAKRKLVAQSGSNSASLYVIGGYDIIRRKYLRTILKYEFVTGRWIHCKKLQERRSSFTPFLYDGKIYCAGGFTSNYTILNTVEFYEPQMDLVYSSDSLPKPVANYALVYQRNNVYLIGGLIQQKNGMVFSSNHFWTLIETLMENPENSEETEVKLEWLDLKQMYPPLKYGIVGHRAVLCEEKQRIYIVGGSCQNPNECEGYSGLLYLDISHLPKSQNFNNQEDSSSHFWMKRNINEAQRSYAGTCIISNKLFIIGGITHKNNHKTITINELSDEEEHHKIQQETSMGKDIQSSDYTISDMMLTNRSKHTKTHLLSFESVNNNIGYYDWRRKFFNTIPLLIRHPYDLNLEHLEAFVIDLEGPVYKHFNKDRYDWLLQWNLW